MIRVILKGGMGNQMFQYAFGRSLSVLKNTNLVLDKRYLEDRSVLKKNFIYRDYDLDIFNISPVFKNQPKLIKYQINCTLLINKMLVYMYGIFKIKSPRYYLERSFNYDPEFTNLSDDIIADGYFQSFKYFENIKELIVSDFKFKDDISENCIELLESIKSNNSICINVRRGDFLTDKSLGAKDDSYYNRAVQYLLNKIDNPYIYVFSDDIEWCENNLKFQAPTKYVNHSFAGKKFRNYFEMMINCKYYVIPNSSFGWWAAFLSAAENKIVVVPEFWFADPKIKTDDLIPENWIRL